MPAILPHSPLDQKAKRDQSEERGAYRPGEVCRLLRISPTTLRLYCDLAAYPGAERDDSRALESFKVGCHHRITRAALVEWLARNQNEQRA